MQKNPASADVHVGARIRLRRNLLDISQEKLGEALGITFQQIQKYEKGTNRVSAGRLVAIGRELGVSAAYFFEGLPDQDGQKQEDEAFAAGMKFYADHPKLIARLAILPKTKLTALSVLLNPEE